MAIFAILVVIVSTGRLGLACLVDIILSRLKLSHDIARDRIRPDIRSVGCSLALGPCFSLFLVGLIADATTSECIASHEYV